MNGLKEVKNLIEKANNIGILPSLEKEESIPVALALFYSLKKIKKNVNLLIDEIPERFHFLVPSISSVLSPQKFILSIKNNKKADVSGVFYEKNEQFLNFYITTKKGSLKKNHVSFKIFSPKNDLLIIIGVDHFDKNKFFPREAGYSDSPPVISINNTDKHFSDANFINLSLKNASLSELTIDFLKSLKIKIGKNTANCLLAGLIFSSDNFQKEEESEKKFGLAAYLKKRGARHKKIVSCLYGNAKTAS